MNYYEMMVIFSPNLTEEEIRTQSGQIEELISQQKGNLHLLDNWGKRKLAYPVKKQRQGVYIWYYFELDPSRIAEVDRKLKMSETLLRFMIIKMEKIQIGNLHKEKDRRSQITQAPAPEPAAAIPLAAVEPASAELAEEPPAETDRTASTTAAGESPAAEE